MELKRAAELTLCALLREALPDLLFVPAKGGGDDVTPVWLPDYDYLVGDVLRATNLALLQAIVVNIAGNSGATEPPFDDVVGGLFVGPPTYLTTAELAVPAQVDSGFPKAPFCAVQIDPGEKVLAQEETSYLTGHVVWVTHADQTNVVEHSSNFKRIYDAMTKIGSGYDILRRLTVHGVDVGSTDQFTDEQRQAHGDTIAFTMGVTEKMAQ